MLHYSQTELLLHYNNLFERRFNLAHTEEARYFTYIHSQAQALIERKLELDYDFIVALNKTLTTIAEIARKPHISVRDEDIVVRSALITEFRNEKFQKTVRQSELWRQKNGAKVPEYSYGSEYVDNYAVYENIVVKMCFHKIETVVNTFMRYYQNYISDLGISFSFDNYTFTSFFAINKNKLIDQRIFDIHEEVKRILETLLLTVRKIEQIKKTHFYHELSNVNDLRDKIVLTNILKFERRYNKVFHFYTNLMRNIDHVDREQASLNYFTSVILKVIHRQFKLTKQKQVVTQNSFNLKFSNRRFLLDVSRRSNVFLFKVRPDARRSIMTTSSLTLVDKLDDYEQIEVVDGFAYVLMDDEIYRYVNGEFRFLKYNYSRGDFALIKMLLSSLLVTINLRKTRAVTTCPICGNSHLSVTQLYNYTCLNCGAEYVVLNEGKNDAFVWIKKVNMEHEHGIRT